MSSGATCRSGHSRLQLDRLAIQRKPAVSMVVNGLRIPLRRVDPGLEDLQNEEIELVNEPGIDHLAFEIGETLGHQRRRYAFGWRLRQTESLELVYIAARAVTDSDDFGGQFQRWKSNHALFGCPQRGKAVIGVADDTGHQRRFKLDHHMPGHGHDVGAALAGGREQDHRAGFEQLVDLRQRQILHHVCNSWTRSAMALRSQEAGTRAHHASNAASASAQTIRWRSFLSRTFLRSSSSSGSSKSKVMLAG